MYIFCIALLQNAMADDTLTVFLQKEKGEDIQYFSPLHQFAKMALLTRTNGKMPIGWYAQSYHGKEKYVTYEMLVGFSTGTSSGERHFDVALNGTHLFFITTKPKMSGDFTLQEVNERFSYSFRLLEYDINGDAFGYLYITVPADMVNETALFNIAGSDQNSRDWLMVFNYSRSLKYDVEPTSLLLRENGRRHLNLYIDFPNNSGASLEVISKHWNSKHRVKGGYNKLSMASYAGDFSGNDKLKLVFNERDTLETDVNIKPIRPFEFHIIHHSHNDIGYSHLQPEVANIQNNNIRDALQWSANAKNKKQSAAWHIESLWAVENFLSTANKKEEQDFVDAVKSGNIILSANYANILSGLCQPEEHNWVLEYSHFLENKYGFDIQNAMITDIPGITQSALLSYVNNSIPYLSIGPNYIETQPDRGDRVGGVIKEQGDQIFYWKPDATSNKKLLVWTAGKGYSYFHNITAGEKQSAWENRISRYCDELIAKNYPFEMVQLRYTKNADNGPVDKDLSTFVEQWNQKFISPQLKITDVNTLFSEFEKKHGSEIKSMTGEISPYWEDGAFSTCREEITNRELVLKTLAMEEFAQAQKKYNIHLDEFYQLHRHLVLFHEHTWGSWCSISDPEIEFTTKQWDIKKSFVDSALVEYNQLANALGFHYSPFLRISEKADKITSFTIDHKTGGLKSIVVNGKNMVGEMNGYTFFQPVYTTGIQPMIFHSNENIQVLDQTIDKDRTVNEVDMDIQGFNDVHLTYLLDHNTGKLSCHVYIDKKQEKDKESFHLAMPFDFEEPTLRYGSENMLTTFNKGQLPGSNKDFICAETKVELEEKHLKAIVHSPQINLFEVGSIIDENKTNGAKVWKTKNEDTSLLFLYVLNNYWHTNFKAWQEGVLEFDIELSFEHGK